MPSAGARFFLALLYSTVAYTSPVGTSGAAIPSTFTANPAIGPGGSTFTDSAHFRIYGSNGTTVKNALDMLEGAYTCYVNALGWRSSGLGFNDDTDEDGPWTKVNVYSVDTLGGPAGVMRSDYKTGISWLEVVHEYLTIPKVTVHEFGHSMTYAAKTWVDQSRTGAWWETVANWFADTYMTSPICDSARMKFGQAVSDTVLNLEKVIGDSFQVLVDASVDSGNYYEAWPFLSYLTYNPDNFSGLGSNTLRDSFLRYNKGSNETPLHTIARLSSSVSIQTIVGRYWARMAFADIGHPTARTVFLNQRSRLNYRNLDNKGNGVYKVKSSRQPQYMGANIIPLTKTGDARIIVKISTSNLHSATLSIRNTRSGLTRYVDFVNGSVSASIADGEEAAIVVANTPALIQYDAFNLSTEVKKGFDYTLTITGATA